MEDEAPTTGWEMGEGKAMMHGSGEAHVWGRMRHWEKGCEGKREGSGSFAGNGRGKAKE